jgi:hypothetical protein
MIKDKSVFNLILYFGCTSSVCYVLTTLVFLWRRNHPWIKARGPGWIAVQILFGAMFNALYTASVCYQVLFLSFLSLLCWLLSFAAQVCFVCVLSNCVFLFVQ